MLLIYHRKWIISRIKQYEEIKLFYNKFKDTFDGFSSLSLDVIKTEFSFSDYLNILSTFLATLSSNNFQFNDIATNDDITKNFNVSFNDNEIIIIPKDITNDDFYEKNYNIEIKTRIKKNYNPTKDNKTLISKTELILDDTHKEVIPIESSIEYHQVKSSLIEHIIQKNENIIYLIISLLAILIVIYLVNK